MNGLAAGRAVADAVLYEGYLLYPYKASALKNQMRWQFGVVVPQASRDAGSTENAHQQTDVLVEGDSATLDVLVRFLHLQARQVEAYEDGRYVPVARLECDGTPYISFDETREHEVACRIRLGTESCVAMPIVAEASRETTELREGDVVRGRIVRERWPLHGIVTITAEKLDGFSKVRTRTENHSQVVESPQRAGFLRTAFISAHTLLSVADGTLISLLEPPGDATQAVEQCRNEHTWPVLTGDGNAERSASTSMLSSPIILYDFPKIAAASPGDTHDATEVDELLSLTVLTLSDEEKAEARATDERARAIVDRAEAMSPERFAALHGSVKALAAEDEAPGAGHVIVAGIRIERGSAVRLHPKGRADVWDMFLEDKLATVAGVHTDFDERTYVAVTVDDDPATEFHQWYGRSLFFSPEEVEPVRPQ